MRKSKKEAFYQEEADSEEEERPSRTQKKKAAQNLQKLGEILVSMASSELEKLDINQELKNAINTAKSITKHGAKKRQLQYIGVLMREADSASITEIVEKMSRLNKS